MEATISLDYAEGSLRPGQLLIEVRELRAYGFPVLINDEMLQKLGVRECFGTFVVYVSANRGAEPDTLVVRLVSLDRPMTSADTEHHFVGMLHDWLVEKLGPQPLHYALTDGTSYNRRLTPVVTREKNLTYSFGDRQYHETA